MSLTGREAFLYDLQGFLRLPAVLNADEVAALNQAVDRHAHLAVDHHQGAFTPALAGSPRRLLRGMLEWDEPWCRPFRALLVHPALPRVLNAILGPGWRLDQPPFAFLSGPGAEGLQLHGPGRLEITEGFSYDFANGRMASGMVAVEWVLSDHPPGAGGLAVIPGSHKSNVPCPPELLDYESDQDVAVQVVADAGDVVVFNEATIHGTLPWRAEHERRVLLYRYSPKHVTMGGGLGSYELPQWADGLDDAARAVLRPPGITDGVWIDDDGNLRRSDSPYAR